MMQLYIFCLVLVERHCKNEFSELGHDLSGSNERTTDMLVQRVT